MIVKNLTSKVLEIRVAEITGGGREYAVYIMPDSTTELEKVIILHPDTLPILINGNPVNSEKILTESSSAEPNVDTPEEPNVDIQSESQEVNPTKFICEECGAEFASVRGLSSHKSRVHA